MLASIAAAVLLTATAFSQPKPQKVTGTVTDETGEPMVGVSVVVEKFPGVGTTTGVSGEYAITVPAKGGEIVFSFIGYKARTENLNGRTRIDVALEPDNQVIEEVVVTALGLTRAEKSVGYAITKLGGDAVNNTVSSNWLNSMSGKVAGLNFDYASAGPGGSVRATLRGEGSLSYDNNSALFVVDGVPIYSDMTSSSSGSVAFNTDAPIDYGNGASDLNPEDIESISVLKGPSATALYGSRAANGAIIITTKSGRRDKGIGITFSSSVTFEQAGFWPDFQTQYGAGQTSQRYYNYWNVPASQAEDGIASGSREFARVAFGPKFDGQMFYQYESRDWETNRYRRLPWVYRDWYKGFFQTGATFNNSVAVESNNGKGTSMRVSFRDTRNDWIVPNTGYKSQSASISVSHKFNKLVKVSAKVNYYRKDSDNLPMSGYSGASPLYTLIWNPNVVDVGSYYNEWKNGRIQQMYAENTPNLLINSTYADNVYMQVYEQLNTLDRDRLYGNLGMTFNLWKEKLTLAVKSGVDLNTDFRTQRKPWYSVNYRRGYYKEQTVRNFEMNNDFLLNYNDEFGDFTINASFGGNNYVKEYNNVQLSTPDGLQEQNVYILQNARNEVKHYARREKYGVNSFYGVVSLGWRDMLFLDVTGRNDWSSALAPGYNSYFYPSVSASVLLDKVFGFSDSAPWINMLKVRGSWANVGNDTKPYQLEQVYSNSSFTGGYHPSGTIQNYYLKPENIESWEVGVEAKLFENRWTFDVAYYDSRSTNQIIPVPIDQATGATAQIINAGAVRNRGVEISTRIQPVKSRNFQYTINLNWSKNWNRLEELAPGVDVWEMNSSMNIGGNIYIRAYPGTELGRLYGKGYQRAPEGAYYVDDKGAMVDCSNAVIVDAANGMPNLMEDVKDLGSIYPEWTGGMSHMFRYKNLTLNMAFSFQWGGHTYSVTHFALAYQGKLTNSLEGRYDGLIHPGVNLREDGTYQPNRTITTSAVDYYNTYVWARENAENNVFDTSFLKLKELRLDYALPSHICRKSGFLQGVSVGVYATNLFCWTRFPFYDPEAGATVGASIKRGIESGAYPMTRTYGVNIKLTF